MATRQKYVYNLNKWNQGTPITKQRMDEIELELQTLSMQDMEDEDSINSLQSQISTVGLDANDAKTTASQAYQLANSASTSSLDGTNAWTQLQGAGVRWTPSNITGATLQNILDSMRTSILSQTTSDINSAVSTAQSILNGRISPIELNVNGAKRPEVENDSLSNRFASAESQIESLQGAVNTLNNASGTSYQTLAERLNAIDGGITVPRTIQTINTEVVNARGTGNALLVNRLDAMQSAIEAVQGSADAKIPTANIVHNLTTNNGNYVLGADQGLAITNAISSAQQSAVQSAQTYADTNKVAKTSIYNGLDKSADDGSVLDARQGKALNNRLVTVETQITDALPEGQNTTLDQRFDAIDGGSAPSRTLPDVISEINTAHGDSTLDDRFDALETNINTIANELSMMDNSGAIADTNTKVDRLNDNVLALGKEIGMLSDETTLLPLSNEIDRSNTRIDALETVIGASDAAGLRKKVADLETEMAGGHDTYQNIDARFDAVESTANAAAVASTVNAALDAIDQRLDAIDGGSGGSGGGMEGLSTRVTAVETAISHQASGNDAGGLTERLSAVEQTLTNTPTMNNVSLTIVKNKNEVAYTEGIPSTTQSWTIESKNDYLLQNTDDKYYYWKYINNAWELISGGSDENGDSSGGTGNNNAIIYNSEEDFETATETNKDINTDYYVFEENVGYHHYRFIYNEQYEEWSRIEIGSIQNININNIKRYNMAKSTGTNANNESVNYLDLYEFDYDQQKASNQIDPDNDLQYRIAHIELPQGSGSGAVGTTCSVIYRTPQTQVLSSAEAKVVKLEFLYYAYEQQDDGTYILHPGTYILKKDNLVIASDTIQSAAVIKEENGQFSEMTAQEKANLRPNLSFDVTKYCADNIVTNFTLTVTGAGITRPRPCSVELVNLYVDSDFNDHFIHNAGEQLRIPLSIAGTKINKTIYVTVDEGTENEQIIQQPHGENAAATTTVTIPGTYLTPGVHSINIKFSQFIGQDTEPSFSNILYYDIACRDTANDTDILLSSSSRGRVLTVEQYATLKIPYYLYVPTGTRVSIVKTNSLNGKTVVEEGKTGEDTYLFKAIEVQNNMVTRYTVTIGCRAESTDPLNPSITFQIDVNPNQYSIEPVLDHLVFDFNPAGYINNPENEEDKFWVDDNNSNIKLSIPTGENFDWDNGGWRYDEKNDAPYFCIKAGSRAQINYSLFQPGMEGDAVQGGSEFKCIFKAINVRDQEAVFLTSLDKSPSIVTEYSSNITFDKQDTEEGNEDTLFSSYFNTKEGHVYTWNSDGELDNDKIAIVVVDNESLVNNTDTAFIATDDTINEAINNTLKKQKKKNVDDYADSIIKTIKGTQEEEGINGEPGYTGSNREALLAFVTKEKLTDKNEMDVVWAALQTNNEWEEFRSATDIYNAVTIDMKQLKKGFKLTYTTDIITKRAFNDYENKTMTVIDRYDDTYAKKEIKRLIVHKTIDDDNIIERVEIEIPYTIVNNTKVYSGVSIIRQILNEIERSRGLEMRAHRANIYLNNGTLTYPYSEEDLIEFEYNIHHPFADKYSAPIMMYEDGVPSAALLYPKGNGALEQIDRGNLILGSDDCDIWIYRMKFYNKELSNTEILSNFYADALNPDIMVDRYERNINTYTTSDPDSITPQSVAAACPELRIIMIEAPNLTGGKNSFIKHSKIRCIYKGTEKNPARPEDNWVALNAYHAGQGTSSDAYGAAGRNLDIIFGFNGQDEIIAAKAKNNYRFDSKYTSTVITGVEDNDNSIGTLDYYVDQVLGVLNNGKSSTDSGYVNKQDLLEQKHFYANNMHIWQEGTGKVNFTNTSVPNNWFNIKLNIASSENTNNALLQKRYDRFLKQLYTTPARARGNKENIDIKNDMEFFNCVVFLKETGTPTEFIEDKNVAVENRQWHFYGIGNIGDSKKTDDSRVNIPGDPNEFCVEISDNDLLNSGFTSGVYYANKEHTTTTFTSAGNYGIKYPVSSEEWHNINNKAYNAITDYEEEGGWENSLEFRYDISTKDGNTIANSDVEKALAAQRQKHNKEVYKEMYEWVVTAPLEGENSFSETLKDWFIEKSPLYWYLFTERYTMIDSRAKNTFYHYGKYYISDAEANGSTVSTLTTVKENAEAAQLEAENIKRAAQERYNQAETARAAATEENEIAEAEAELSAARTALNTAKSDYTNAVVAYYNAKTNLDIAIYVQEHADCFIQDNDAAMLHNGYRFELWDYDNDTAIGINNNGKMAFSAGMEDVDKLGSTWVYNEATSVFWCRIRDEMYNKLSETYNSRREDCFNSEDLIDEFDSWQNQFAENLWRIDFERKYYRPFKESDEITYLQQMANGRKRYQRREFERNMGIYIDSKYRQVDAYDPEDFIQFRPTPQQHVNQNKMVAITLYNPMYINFDIANQSGRVAGNHTRGFANGTYTFNFYEGLENANNPQSRIFNASCIKEITGLENYYSDDFRFGTAKKLRKLYIGTDYVRDENNNILYDDNGNKIIYNNPKTTTISLGKGNPVLEELDIRNCTGLAATLNLGECISLQTLNAAGTQLSEVIFAISGLLKTIELPSTITSLEFNNLSFLTTVSLAGYNNIISYISNNTFKYNSQALVNAILGQIRTLKLNDINWTIGDITDLEPFAQLQKTLNNEMYLAGTIRVTGEWSTVEAKAYAGITGQYVTQDGEQVWTTLATNNNAVWPGLILDTSQGHEQQKYAVTYKYDDYIDEDGTPILGNEITTLYIKRGDPVIDIWEYINEYDEVVHVLNEMPHRDPTVRNSYQFGLREYSNYITMSGWKQDGATEPLSRTGVPLVTSNMIIETYFKPITRTYPVKWYLYHDRPDAESLVMTSSNAIPYGGGYDLEAPTVQDIHTAGLASATVDVNGSIATYSIFDGWEKLPININPQLNDTSFNIYAKWHTDEISLVDLFNNTNNLTEDQLLVLSALNDSNKKIYTKTKVAVNSRAKFNMGYDSTVEGTTLVNNNSVLRLDLGTVHPRATTVQPFKASNNAFTIAIDYCFNANATYDTDKNSAILASCYSEDDGADTATGLALYYNLNTNTNTAIGPRVGFGNIFNNSACSVGIGGYGQRNVVVLRHPQDSPILYVYSGLGASESMSSEVSVQQISWNQYTSDAYLNFGRLTSNMSEYPSLNITTTKAAGTIYWAKYWDKDLGAGESKQLAMWPHEDMEYAITLLSDNATSGNRTGSNVIPSIYLTSVNASSHGKVPQRGDFSNGTMGWGTSVLHDIYKNRVMKGLPVRLQAILCKPMVTFRTASIVDDNLGISRYQLNPTPSYSRDYIFAPSAANLSSSAASDYSTEESTTKAAAPYSWFNDAASIVVYDYDPTVSSHWTQAISTTAYYNLRFLYTPLKWSTVNPLRIFRESTNFTQEDTAVKEISKISGGLKTGDIFIPNSGEAQAYVYVSDTDISTYGAQVAPNEGKLATEVGGWAPAVGYWTRSMSAGNQNNSFCYVDKIGNLIITNNNSANANGLNINYTFSI